MPKNVEPIRSCKRNLYRHTCNVKPSCIVVAVCGRVPACPARETEIVCFPLDLDVASTEGSRDHIILTCIIIKVTISRPIRVDCLALGSQYLSAHLVPTWLALCTVRGLPYLRFSLACSLSLYL